jgi:hypothetical protein
MTSRLALHLILGLSIFAGSCSSHITISNEEFLTQICKTNPDDSSQDQFRLPGRRTVYRCEDHFRVSPPVGSADMPGSNYYLDGTRIDIYCGGGLEPAAKENRAACDDLAKQKCEKIADDCY